jgi:hypothetical protein
MIRRTARETAISRMNPPRSSARRRVVRSARRPAQSMKETPDTSSRSLAVLAHDPQQSLLQRGLRADVDFSADRHDGAVITGADTQRHGHNPTLTAPAAGSHPRHG